VGELRGVALAVGSGTILTLIGRDGRRGGPTGAGPEDRLARLVDPVSPNLFTMLLTVVAGCLQIAGANRYPASELGVALTVDQNPHL
jgi:hypothetical protein